MKTVVENLFDERSTVAELYAQVGAAKDLEARALQAEGDRDTIRIAKDLLSKLL